MMAKVGNCVGREKLCNLIRKHLFFNVMDLYLNITDRMLAMLATCLKFSIWIQYQKEKNALIYQLLQFNKVSSQHCQQKMQSHLFHWKLATYTPAIATNIYANLSLQSPTKEGPCRYFQ